jgi:CubicO group peptidase (beta-lactamase class C family)
MVENGSELFEQLSTFVEEQIAQKGVPGAAIGILYQDQTYTAGFGVTNVDHPIPVTDETLFQIGSISKTFTCLAIMRLVEQGRLDLRGAVRSYVPEFAVADETASAQTTLWHLLTHMSGWVGDFFENTGAGDDALAVYVGKMAELEQLAPIGTVWSYNNAGFSVAGRVIEQVTGQCYEDAMRELVFEPLGLARCFYGPADVITHRFAVGHGGGRGEAKVLRPWPLPRAVHPAGGIVCDAHQLLRYARFQMGDGTVAGEGGQERTALVQPETLAEMHAPQASRWGEREQIGLAWFIDEIDGTRQLSHGGGTVGQISLLALYPAHQLAMVILTNASEGGGVTGAMRRWVLEHYLGLADPEPEPIEASEEELAAYAGFYTRPFTDIELGMLNGRLIGQAVNKQAFPSQDQPVSPPPPPVSLALCDKDRLLITAGPGKGGRADVIRNSDGTIGWLRIGRLHRRLEKRPTRES